MATAKTGGVHVRGICSLAIDDNLQFRKNIHPCRTAKSFLM